MIKKIIMRVVPKRKMKQLINFKILAIDYAQYKTIKNWVCVNKANNKIPWYTYPAIEYLSSLDFTQKSIFEYGSGYSSIFWSNRAKNVTSVDNDINWIEKIKSEFNSNQTVLFKKDDCEYENSIAEVGKKFDVIIIDGIRRVECSKVIKYYLNNDSSDGFMIILDNSDWYNDIARYLKEELDLIEIDFHGFGPINAYTWTTSIFLSRNFNFKSINNIQPGKSIAFCPQ